MASISKVQSSRSVVTKVPVNTIDRNQGVVIDKTILDAIGGGGGIPDRVLDHILDTGIHLTPEEAEEIRDLLAGAGVSEKLLNEIFGKIDERALKDHTHIDNEGSVAKSEQIIESDEKRFVSKEEVELWNARYSNEEIDKKLESISSEDIDLTGYATEEFVNSAIENIELTPGPQGEKGEQGPAGIFNIDEVYEMLDTENKSVLGAINELLNMIKSLQPGTPQEADMYYGFIPYEVSGSISHYGNITKSMISNSKSSITSALPSTLDKTSVGFVPEGGLVIVAVPSTHDYTVTKDNGIGGKTAFGSSFEAPSANGIEVIWGGVPYKLYGEMMLLNGELFIYVD